MRFSGFIAIFQHPEYASKVVKTLASPRESIVSSISGWGINISRSSCLIVSNLQKTAAFRPSSEQKESGMPIMMTKIRLFQLGAAYQSRTVIVIADLVLLDKMTT